MDRKGVPPKLPPRNSTTSTTRPPPPNLPPRAPNTRPALVPYSDPPPPYEAAYEVEDDDPPILVWEDGPITLEDQEEAELQHGDKTRAHGASSDVVPDVPSGEDQETPSWEAQEPPAWESHGPRSLSTQSLVPTKSVVQGERRKLLLIYIHGFMGNETSFQSFPAHVHSLVSSLVKDSHVVYTKLYPRYKQKGDMSFARDDFSKWLAPHEGASTDVILLGHSMGGLLSAEVVLKMAYTQHAGPYLQHRLIGGINFDVPFLGMHPGVIKAGLSSIFNPDASKKDKAEASQTLAPILGTTAGQAMSPASPQASASSNTAVSTSPSNPHDPNYNPSFENDVVLPVRKGWQSALHFINKHSDNIYGATKQLVTSHMQFGGAMADFNGLKVRYTRVRALEEKSVAIRESTLGGKFKPPRRRFVNYYTASTGRPPARPKDDEIKAIAGASTVPSPSAIALSAGVVAASGQVDGAADQRASSTTESREPLSEAAHDDDEVHGNVDDSEEHEHDQEEDDNVHHEFDLLDPQPVLSQDEDSEDEPWTDAMEELQQEETPTLQSSHTTITASSSLANQSDVPTVDEAASAQASHTDLSLTTTAASSALESPSQTSLALTPSQSLPPIAELPPKPERPDFSQYTDKDTRKVVEKDFARASKAYEKAAKDREKALRDRHKLEEKLARKAQKDAEKAVKEHAKNKTAVRQQKESEYEEILKLERRETDKEWKEIQQQDTEQARLQAEEARMRAEEARLRGDAVPAAEPKKEKEAPSGPPKDRKFCILPPKDSAGNRDPCWPRIYMKDVDEVGAHCGLFFPSDTYEQLVQEVGTRIQDWVRESESERVVEEDTWVRDVD